MNPLPDETDSASRSLFGQKQTLPVSAMLNQIGSLRPASRMALARTLAAILFWRATAVLSVLKAKGPWHEQLWSAHSNKTMTVAFARIARKHWHAEFCPEAFLQSKVVQLWLGNLHLWSTSASVEADLAKEVKPLKNTLPSFILVGIKSRYKFAGLSHTKYLCLLNGRLSLICLSLALSRILLFSWKNKAARSDHLKKL